MLSCSHGSLPTFRARHRKRSGSVWFFRGFAWNFFYSLWLASHQVKKTWKCLFCCWLMTNQITFPIKSWLGKQNVLHFPVWNFLTCPGPALLNRHSDFLIKKSSFIKEYYLVDNMKTRWALHIFWFQCQLIHDHIIKKKTCRAVYTHTRVEPSCNLLLNRLLY